MKRIVKSSDVVDETTIGDETSEYDLPSKQQEYTSEKTSINSNKLPAIFKLVHFNSGTVNLDYGGGKFDNAAEYLAEQDVINLVYDPFNRSQQHNRDVIRQIRENGGADTATCSNVLNVIKEPEARLNVLDNIKELVKPSGTVYITVYEGTGVGDSKPTKSGYQLNKKTADYLEEIQQVFPDATRKGKLIVCHPQSSVQSAADLDTSKGVDNIMASEDEDDIEWKEYDEWIEIDIDSIIHVDEHGQYEFDDSTDDRCWWASPDGWDWCSEEYQEITIADPDDVYDAVVGLLGDKIPTEPGDYHITCEVILDYFIEVEVWISNFRSWSTEEPYYISEEDWDEELVPDSAICTYRPERSRIRNLLIEKV